MHHNRYLNKGFTLIELLVVIAIISILSAVALVNLNSARREARLARMQATMDNIQKAALLCMDNYNGTGSPTVGQLNCQVNNGAGNSEKRCNTSDSGVNNNWNAPGFNICTDGNETGFNIGVWPEVEDGWTYAWDAPPISGTDGNDSTSVCDLSIVSNSCDNPFSDAVNGAFQFAVCEGDDQTYNCTTGGYYIYCNQEGCYTTTAVEA